MVDTAKTRGLLSEGLGVGLLGAATVAVWFLVVDLINGAPLQTPAAMGSAIFMGARSPEAVQITATTVGLYTIFHGAMFFLIGLGSSALLRAADRAPGFLGLIILVFAVLQVLFIGGVAIMAEFLLGYLAWWAVFGGNLLSSVAMVVLLLRWHPATAERLKHPEAPMA
jgi:hypothetical protein